MIVNENYGDIIFTREVERCKERHGFSVWLCRKTNPESKAVVESGVKFIKCNFARHRVYETHLLWTAASVDWLARTGNGKKHTETKRYQPKCLPWKRHISSRSWHLPHKNLVHLGYQIPSEKTTALLEEAKQRWAVPRKRKPTAHASFLWRVGSG